jgi:aspartate aminotransferase
MISKRINAYLEKSSWIRKLFEEGQRMRRDGGGPVYDFCIGNPSLEPPEKLRKTLLEMVSDTAPGKHRYMPNAGYDETRQAVAAGLERELGLEIEKSHIIMTVGAAGAINAALKALIDPGDEVIVVAPYFVEYRFYIENHSGRMVVAESSPDFDLSPAAIGRKISSKTRCVLINNPNNPTGVVYRQETLDELGVLLNQASQGRKVPIFLIDDAPYRKLIYDAPRCPSVFHSYDHALMATSHSKDLGIPGERIGFLAVSPRCPGSESIVDAVTFTNRTLGYVNAPALMQRVVTALQDETIDLAWYRRKRDRLFDALTRFGYDLPRPSGAFYLFPRAPGGDDVAFIEAMKSRRVLVVPGSGFGTPGYFRISYCVDDEVIEGALPAFEAAIRQFSD